MDGIAQFLRTAEIVKVAAYLLERRLRRRRVAKLEFGVFTDMLFQTHVEIFLGPPDILDDEFMRILIDDAQGIIAVEILVTNSSILAKLRS